jgi:hypothetical protein
MRLLVVGFLLAVLVPHGASAQDAGDIQSAVGVWSLASQRLDAPGHTFKFDPDLFSVTRGGNRLRIRYRSADPEACRAATAATAVGMWTVVSNSSSGSWTILV